MDLFLIRHASAVPRAPELDDEARPLTARGRKRWARAVRGLGRLGVRFERVYHSPLVRAVETAEELLPLCDGESVVSVRLAKPPTAALLEELSGDRVAVVGHEPWLSELLALLMLDAQEPGARFVMKKGGIAWLEGEPKRGGMTMRAFLPPKVLRSLR